ncbi:MAG: RHS repeat-associated core domain-containing protein [Bacteroidaceae bacterium]|nr:RHS repeat-associated core domain-containing protein [Bacteroidaceae bacterium]
MTQTIHHYPYGGTLTHSTNQGVQKYKYNGKEFDRTHGLDWYDYSARQYDPASGRFTSMDPLCEKYYNISPYSYCEGNPIRYVDPDGRRIKSNGEEELDMIKMTLPEDARDYVSLNQDGFIDDSRLMDYTGDSGNMQSLQKLAKDDMVIEVFLDNGFDFSDSNGNHGHSDMRYDGVIDGFEDVNFQYTAGIYTGECGLLGKNLFPDNVGEQNSPSSNMRIVVNSEMSPLGAAETFSHEAYGHGLLYLQNGHNHLGASHQGEEGKETNLLLKQMIMNSRKETIRNNR